MVVVSLISHANNNPDAKNNVTISFSIENEIKSRSSVPYRYIMEIYEGTDATTQTLVSHMEQNTNVFTIDLKPDTPYICLLWADRGTPDENPTGTFDASSLLNVKLNNGKDMREAFSRRADFILDGSTTSNDIVLKRVVAEVELMETASVTLGQTIGVSFTGYNEFNVFTESVTGSATSISNNVTTTATTGLVGSFLTFASVDNGTNGDVVVDLVATYNSATNNISGARLSANHKTKIYGEFAVSN